MNEEIVIKCKICGEEYKTYTPITIEKEICFKCLSKRQFKK